MKRLLFLLVFLVSCAAPEPEIIYIEITSTLEPTLETQPTGCDLYFNSWEVAKNATPSASGQYWWLGEHEYLVFATSEESFLHEGGHVKDAENEYPSQNADFQNAVDEYVNNPPADVQNELHHYLFVVQRDGQYDDAFAQLYMWDILYELPTIFEEFYAD